MFLSIIFKASKFQLTPTRSLDHFDGYHTPTHWVNKHIGPKESI